MRFFLAENIALELILVNKGNIKYISNEHI